MDSRNSPYTHYNTAIRLAAWRKYKAKHPYLVSDKPLPPSWFGAISGMTVNTNLLDHEGRERTPTVCYSDGLGHEGEIDRPFRFTGFAHEVISLRPTGRYGDDDGGQLCRGVVFQLPSRRGQAIFLAGVEWGEAIRSGSGFDSGGGWIEIGRGDTYDCKEDAAHAADRLAEIAAEREREYQEECRREEEEREQEELIEQEEEAQREEEEREREELIGEEERVQREEEIADHLSIINTRLCGSDYRIGQEGRTIFLTDPAGDRL